MSSHSSQARVNSYTIYWRFPFSVHYVSNMETHCSETGSCQPCIVWLFRTCHWWSCQCYSMLQRNEYKTSYAGSTCSWSTGNCMMCCHDREGVEKQPSQTDSADVHCLVGCRKAVTKRWDSCNRHLYYLFHAYIVVFTTHLSLAWTQRAAKQKIMGNLHWLCQQKRLNATVFVLSWYNLIFRKLLWCVTECWNVSDWLGHLNSGKWTTGHQRTRVRLTWRM